MAVTTRSTRAHLLGLVPLIAVITVVLLCLAASVGWLSGVAELRNVYPGWASMKLVTAACLSTLALALYVEIRIGHRLHGFVVTGAVAVAAVALVNGLSFIDVSSFGLTRLFGRPGTAGAPMAAATAVTLLPLVFGLAAGPRRRVLTQAVVFIGATVPYAAVVGYLINAQGLYSFGPYGTMSISTAVACLLLAGGILTVDESTWLRRLGARDDFSAVVVRRLAVPSLLLSPSLGYFASVGVSLDWWEEQFAPVLIVTGTSLLSVALVGWVGVLLARLERQRQDATTLAELDPLTGAGNRRFLDRALTHEFDPSRTGPIALIAMDLDDFKRINDRHGHHQGDAALVGFADCVRANTRATDVFIRTGGDEFSLLLPNTTDNAAQAVAVKLLAVLAAWQQRDPHRRPHVSIGVAVRDHTVSSSLDLQKRADLALYDAKTNGKHRVVVYENLVPPPGT